MYTKNPVSGRNETLVNTSMLKGAIDGVTSKIADKADKGALEGLSLYAEIVADSVAGKADKAVVEEVSVYAEGLLPKDVYGTMVDAYVGLACKVADPDVLEGAAKVAYAANPVKYATSNPSDDRCAEVMWGDFTPDNPIYEAVHAAGSTVELPPFLRLKTFASNMSNAGSFYSWKTELPNLTNGDSMFTYCSGLESCNIELHNLTNGTNMFQLTGLTSWTTELPNLTDGTGMFDSTPLTSWTTGLPNLTYGSQMFYSTQLTSFSSPLPSLHTASSMFESCQLDIDSLRCIAEGINDVSGSSVGDHAITIGLSDDAFSHPDKQKYKDILNAKGWIVTF